MNLPNLRTRFFYMVFLGRDTPLPKRKKKKPTKKSRKKRCLEIEAALDAWTKDHRNIRPDFSRADLAGEIGATTNELVEYFQLVLSKDFRTWKTEVRIRWAMHLLETNPAAPIHDVAASLGFIDDSNFHRQFKKMTGMTPAAWRDDAGRKSAAMAGL